MRYRLLGRTGLTVSELGVGGHEYRRPLPTTLRRWGEIDRTAFLQAQPQRNSLIKRAIKAGVNYFDTTHAEEVRSIGLALKTLGIRKKVHVAIMILRPFIRMEETPRNNWHRLLHEAVHKKLQLLHSDYVDILNLHMPENHYSPDRLTAALKVVEELKEEGKVTAVGASSHDPRFLAEVIRKYDCFDAVMIRYNYHLQTARDVLFPLCKVYDVGVVVMKPFAWPYYCIPFTRFGPVKGEAGDATPAQMSLRWILTSPEVATVVAGMNSLEELEENLGSITQKVRVDEQILAQYLAAATGSQVKKQLEELLHDPAVDIRHFAKRTLREDLGRL